MFLCERSMRLELTDKLFSLEISCTTAGRDGSDVKDELQRGSRKGGRELGQVVSGLVARTRTRMT